MHHTPKNLNKWTKQILTERGEKSAFIKVTANKDITCVVLVVFQKGDVFQRVLGSGLGDFTVSLARQEFGWKLGKVWKIAVGTVVWGP